MHLVLVDGSTFIFRAYHALPPLTRKSDGLPVGAVSGFCNMLYKLVDDLKGDDAPTHMAVIFDYSGKSFRNQFYPEYKAHRPEAPEDLVPQFPLTRDATRAFSIPCIEQEGFRGRRHHRDLYDPSATGRRPGDRGFDRQGPDAIDR